MALVVGVDSSTQSTKLELRDASTGRLLGSGSAPHPPVSPPRSEQDPAAWWDALGRAAADLGGQSVGAVSIGGQQHGMTGGGARSRAVRRVLADLSGRLVEVHATAEMVARGAAVQAAATLAGTQPSDVAAAWRPRPDEVVEPDGRADQTALRAAYHDVRDRDERSGSPA